MSDEAIEAQDHYFSESPAKLELVRSSGALVWSDPRDQIVPALVAAWGVFPTLTKTKYADTGAAGKYTFANLASVLEATRPHLSANGLMPIQTPTNVEGVEEIGGLILHTTLMRVETEIIHISGQSVRSAQPLEMKAWGEKPLIPQRVGILESYARRYMLLAMLCLGAEDDDARSLSLPPEDKEKLLNAREVIRRQINKRRATTSSFSDKVIEGLALRVSDGTVEKWEQITTLGGLRNFRDAIKAWEPGEDDPFSSAAISRGDEAKAKLESNGHGEPGGGAPPAARQEEPAPAIDPVPAEQPEPNAPPSLTLKSLQGRLATMSQPERVAAVRDYATTLGVPADRVVVILNAFAGRTGTKEPKIAGGNLQAIFGEIDKAAAEREREERERGH